MEGRRRSTKLRWPRHNIERSTSTPLRIREAAVAERVRSSAIPLVRDRLPWQRSLRWTRPALDKRRVAWAILIGVALTAIELIGFGIGMRGQIAKELRPAPAEVLQVFLIPDEEQDIAVVPPEPEPPARIVRRTSGKARNVAARPPKPVSSAPALDAANPQTPVLELYSPDGELRLPDNTASLEREEVGFSAHAPASGDPFARRNPVPYEPTRFESVWAPSRETLGQELIRKSIVTHTWLTPWGTQVTCSASFIFAMLGGCTWGYAPIATAEELKAMRADPPMPRNPVVPPQDPASAGDAVGPPPPAPPISSSPPPIDLGDSGPG